MLSRGFEGIKKVAIIDDNAVARAAMAESVEDANFDPVERRDGFDSVDVFLDEISKSADAAIFDHHLRKGRYGITDGAELVARLNKRRFPALLVTSWTRMEIEEIRQFRRYIPVLMDATSVEPQQIRDAFGLCVGEFQKEYSPERRPVRTLVRVDYVEKDQPRGRAGLVIPAWNPKKIVPVPGHVFGKKLWRTLDEGTRLFAKVNIGAVDDQDLFFEDFVRAELNGGFYADYAHS